MGCCPSKSRAKYDTHCSVAGEKQAVCTTNATRSTGATSSVAGKVGGDVSPAQPPASPSPCSSSNNQNDATSMTCLMDRGDGTLIFKSDGDPTPSSPPPVATREIVLYGIADNNSSNNDDAKEDNGNGNAVTTRKAELTLEVTTGEPLSASASPRKAPVNYEEMPINSMYHRIHTVEAEAQDARRQEELRVEAERREREVREFKASMLTS